MVDGEDVSVGWIGSVDELSFGFGSSSLSWIGEIEGDGRRSESLDDSLISSGNVDLIGDSSSDSGLSEGSVYGACGDGVGVGAWSFEVEWLRCGGTGIHLKWKDGIPENIVYRESGFWI